MNGRPTNHPTASLGITPPGATPLNADEREGLLPGHIRTQGELNAWEATNILQAERWIASWQRRRDVLTVPFLTALHRRMFGETWRWAGTYRRSMINISPYPAFQVPQLMHDLVNDVRAQRAGDKGLDVDNIAIGYHHRMVRIHPWPNGNGRHARLAIDLALVAWGRPRFSWGRNERLEYDGTKRTRYLSALRAADKHDYSELRAFVRS